MGVRIFLGKKGRKKSVVGVFLVFSAVGGQFRPFETLRFTVTFQTVPIPSRTELCSLKFDKFFRFSILENQGIITVIKGGMTPRWFSGFPFLGNFWAPGPLLADSSENFSTERPVFVASPDRRVPKSGTEDF